MATIGSTREPESVSAAEFDPALLAELIRLAVALRNKKPTEAAAPDVLQLRRDFLRESLGETREAETTFERIIRGDDLQPIAYLERGTIAARAVARVELPSGRTFGTGFLIAPRVLITNNHVLPDETTAARSIAQFQYEVDLSDAEVGPISYRLAPGELFFTSPETELDYTVVAVEPTSRDSATPLARFGYLPLIETVGKVAEGEWLTIIQHPDGTRKQICVRDNQFLKRSGDVLWYSTDTKPGSSGSPVFNNDWYVVALHHSGVPEKRNGTIQTNADGSTKWIANEGIRVSRIVQTLKEARPSHPLLRPLYEATPTSARITGRPTETFTSSPQPRAKDMADNRTISVPLEIKLEVKPDGQVAPVSVVTREGRESIGSPATVMLEKKTRPTASFDAPFDDDYSKRKGYDPNFLGDKDRRVALPHMSPGLEAAAAPLQPEKKTGNKYVLHYHNYSVAMHAKRRLAIYSAANVSFGHRFEMSRPTDVWRRDPRILAEHQLENWYYASNKFDRGHLTRREDLEFGGKPKDALISAADTCHWTNRTPQHERFNQNKEIWQGIERYVPEDRILNGEFNAQVITGPILDDGDPDYRKIKYPLQYWKVVAALTNSGKLFATAYIASQEEIITRFGIEVTEIPFGAYKTYQTKIAEIERITGLTFMSGTADKTPLSKSDPLELVPPEKRRRRMRPTESTGLLVPEIYREITSLEDIQLPPVG